MLLRTLSVVGLLLALAACCTASPEPIGAEPTLKSLASVPSPIRAWRSDGGTTRTILLTIYDDDSADLFMRGPAESVPHWGELNYPERLDHASIERVGDRTFLLFITGNYPLEVAEIAERSGDHLVLWFHHDFDFGAKIYPQLGKLSKVAPPMALELVLQPLPDLQDEPAGTSTHMTRFST